MEWDAASTARSTAFFDRLALRADRASARLFPLRVAFWCLAGLNAAIVVGDAYPPLHMLSDWYSVYLPEPIQVVCGIFFIVVFVAFMFACPDKRQVRRARLQAGLCPACGYDLRATHEKCPECGNARGA